MRKIEKEMLQAIEEGRDWQKDNTSVIMSRPHPHGIPDGYSVYLHGHRIAYFEALPVEPWGNVEKALQVDYMTLQNWPTATTKSRLRALGVNLTQRKGKIYINGDFVCTAH